MVRRILGGIAILVVAVAAATTATHLTIPVTYLGGRRRHGPLAPDHALVPAGRHPPPAIPDRHAAK
jgi:hypothetical protein